MYPRRNFIRLVHKVDLYERHTIKNDMGQDRAIWNLINESIPCLYVRSGSSTGIRIAPTTDESDYYLVYFNHDAPVDYGVRLKNITTKLNNESINPGWMQIVQIDKEIAFSGKIQYIQAKVKSVIE